MSPANTLSSPHLNLEALERRFPNGPAIEAQRPPEAKTSLLEAVEHPQIQTLELNSPLSEQLIQTLDHCPLSADEEQGLERALAELEAQNQSSSLWQLRIDTRPFLDACECQERSPISGSERRYRLRQSLFSLSSQDRRLVFTRVLDWSRKKRFVGLELDIKQSLEAGFEVAWTTAANKGAWSVFDPLHSHSKQRPDYQLPLTIPRPYTVAERSQQLLTLTKRAAVFAFFAWLSLGPVWNFFKLYELQHDLAGAPFPARVDAIAKRAPSSLWSWLGFNLDAQLHSADAWTRRNALHALARLDQRSAEQASERLLQDPVPLVREGALLVLARGQNGTALKTCLNMHPVLETRLLALRLLAETRAQELPVLEILQDPKTPPELHLELLLTLNRNLLAALPPQQQQQLLEILKQALLQESQSPALRRARWLAYQRCGGSAKVLAQSITDYLDQLADNDAPKQDRELTMRAGFRALSLCQNAETMAVLERLRQTPNLDEELSMQIHRVLGP